MRLRVISVCVCTCICICICIFVSVYLCGFNECVYICECMRSIYRLKCPQCEHLKLYILHTYTHIYTHINTLAGVQAHPHAHSPSTHKYMHVTHAHAHSRINDLCTHTYTDNFTLMHANIYSQSIQVFHEHTHIELCSLRRKNTIQSKTRTFTHFMLIHAST